MGNLYVLQEQKVDKDKLSTYFNLKSDGTGNYFIEKVYLQIGHERQKNKEDVVISCCHLEA